MQIIPHYNEPFLFYAFWIFVGLVFFQVIYIILFFGRLAYRKPAKQNPQLPPVSVVIAARNESDNLFENLPKILDQYYPAEFEVIVINHQSIDDSKYLLDALQRSYPHLVVIEMERNQHMKASKKLPLTLGIKKARFEHLILTDADCSPSSDHWLVRMAEQFSEQKQLILGYGPYKPEPGFLNKVIRFDTTMIAVHYFSMAINGLPYMGVGRNMAYTKTLFNSVKGFKSHYSLPSGDDDLFVQQTATRKNTAIQISPDSFMHSDGKSTWETFVLQKARHYSTAPRYNFFKKTMLGIYPGTLWMLLISFVILVSQANWWIHAVAGFGLVILLKWWLLGKCFQRLKSNKFIAALPLLDLMYVVALPFFYYSTLQKRSSQWK